MARRDLRIDTLRGLACVLLVGYHVIGSTSDSGMRIADGWLREANDRLVFLRMPLFTILSDFVYGLRPYSGGCGRFFAGKARRLLLPMLVVGTAFALVQAYTPGANATVQHWHLLHIIPVAHFWFLEALFLIFLVVVPLEALGWLRTIPGWALCLAASAGASLAGLGHPWFALNGAVYLLPFFPLGAGLCRFGLCTALPGGGAALLLIAVAGLIVAVPGDSLPDKRSLFGLLAGGLGCFALLGLRMQSKPLAAIGGYSYTIYLYHVFFTAGCRILLERLDAGSMPLLFAGGLVAGLTGPIVLERIVLRTLPGASLPLLGRKAKKPGTEAA